MRLGISWLTNALVLLVVTVLLTGVSASGAGAVLLAAAVFGVLNTVLKPLLRLITLPLAIFTLGIAWFFVSMLMLVITKAIVSGFDIDGFWTLVAATLIVWVVNVILDYTPGPWQVTGKRRRRRARRAFAQPAFRAGPRVAAHALPRVAGLEPRARCSRPSTDRASAIRSWSSSQWIGIATGAFGPRAHARTARPRAGRRRSG